MLFVLSFFLLGVGGATDASTFYLFRIYAELLSLCFLAVLLPLLMTPYKVRGMTSFIGQGWQGCRAETLVIETDVPLL